MSGVLEERQREIIERFLIIEDRHERLNAITGSKIAGLHLAEADCNEELLVPGCVSRVWLQVSRREQSLEVRYATESAFLNGLVGLLVELYADSSILDAASFSPTIIQGLELHRLLSPTRLQGLASVTEKIQESARRFSHDVDRLT